MSLSTWHSRCYPRLSLPWFNLVRSDFLPFDLLLGNRQQSPQSLENAIAKSSERSVQLLLICLFIFRNGFNQRIWRHDIWFVDGMFCFQLNVAIFEVVYGDDNDAFECMVIGIIFVDWTPTTIPIVSSALRKGLYQKLELLYLFPTMRIVYAACSVSWDWGG